MSETWNPADDPNPAPERNSSEPVWLKVLEDVRGTPGDGRCQATRERLLADMTARHEMGIRKYGTPLQAGNGRDALLDLYGELQDATAYSRQAFEESPSAESWERYLRAFEFCADVAQELAGRKRA